MVPTGKPQNRKWHSFNYTNVFKLKAHTTVCQM